MSLSIKGLVKRFGEKTLFDGFSYEFSNNGLYFLCGESGVGKTTLLRLIAGLDKDYVGEISGGGLKEVSFQFQEYRLFPELNVLQNATLGCHRSKSKIEKAKQYLERLWLDPNTLKLRPDALSGGMKQRVSLVRALMKDSGILILDEQTKELDPKLCAVVNEIIKEESKKRLVIVVSHRTDDLSSFSSNIIYI